MEKECLICKDKIGKSLYCHENHIVCESCKEIINECPICHIKLFFDSNRDRYSFVWHDPFLKFFRDPKNQTLELCMKAVEYHGYLLGYIDDDLRTEEICLAAVKNYSPSVQFVPFKHHTPELWDTVLYYDDIFPIKYLDELLPKEPLGSDFWVSVVKLNPRILKYLDRKLHTVEMYKIALKQNISNLIYIRNWNLVQGKIIIDPDFLKDQN